MVAALLTGLYLTISMHQAVGFILDKSLDSFKAIKMSFRVTKPYIVELLGLYIIMGFILFISALPLGIGLIWTVPFSYILYGEVYKRLSNR